MSFWGGLTPTHFRCAAALLICWAAVSRMVLVSAPPRGGEVIGGGTKEKERGPAVDRLYDDDLLASGAEKRNEEGEEEEEGRVAQDDDDDDDDDDENEQVPSRIRYRLVQGRPYRPRYFRYSCGPPIPGVVEAHPEHLRLPGVLDVFPDITTSLKVAVVGDSVGGQIARVMEEALGAAHRVALEDPGVSDLVVAGPVRGGGAFLSARLNGMLWQELRNDRDAAPPPGQRRGRRHLLDRLLSVGVGVGGRDGTSNEDDGARRENTTGTATSRVRRRHRKLRLAPQPWNRSRMESALEAPVLRMGAVDVLVQRITFPWTQLEMITMESLERNTRMASELFGMRTLVYVNFYFCNNVEDPDMYKTFQERLQVVRNFTQTYVPPPGSPLKHVLLLDIDRLVDLLNEENGRVLGYDVENEPFEKWMMSHYRGPPTNGTHHHYHAQLCGSPTPDHALSCVRNMNFVDGMHFCPSTFGGRVAAGIACLIECSWDGGGGGGGKSRRRTRPNATDSRREGGGGDEPRNPTPLRECERRCNDRFMSLRPVSTSEMVPYNQSSEM